MPIKTQDIFASANSLMHSGRKGMKRGYHIFGDRDYEPIGTPAKGEEEKTFDNTKLNPSWYDKNGNPTKNNPDHDEIEKKMNELSNSQYAKHSAISDARYLSHGGIKGMLWGVRRWQNPDGTLTAEGRLRYNEFRRRDGSTDYYRTDLGQEEFDADVKNIKDTISKVGDAERTIHPAIESITKNKEASDLALENAQNHARIETMDTEEIKKEIERITSVNRLRELTDKKKSSNYDTTMKILGIVGGATAAAASAVGIWASVQNLINAKNMRLSLGATHSAMFDPIYLSHSGRKGMKRGMSIFQDDYVPIGQIASGEKESKTQARKNADRISRARATEEIKSMQNTQQNVRTYENTISRIQNSNVRLENKIKQQKIIDEYNYKKNKKETKQQYSTEKKVLDDAAGRDLDKQQDQEKYKMKMEKQRFDQEKEIAEMQNKERKKRLIVGAAISVVGAVLISNYLGRKDNHT